MRLPPVFSAELLAEDEDRIERGAQFVRHVGEEFGFVFGRERQFRRLFLQRAAGLLDFAALAFHFDVLLGQLPRLLRQLFVGLLQFLLLRLQFHGELLGLLQQVFRAHRRFNRVEHHADGLGELFEERQVRHAERHERGQFDHGLGLAFKQHWQHHDVDRDAIRQDSTQCGCNPTSLPLSRMRSFSTAH